MKSYKTAKLLQAVFLTASFSAMAANVSQEHTMFIVPRAAEARAEIKLLSSGKAEIGWLTEKSVGYVVEYRRNFSSPWQSWAMDTGTGQLMNRPIQPDDEMSFYVSRRSSIYKTGQEVPWQIILPDIPDSTLKNCTAVWNFDEDEIRTVKGLDIRNPIKKTYANEGTKFLTVTVSLPGGDYISKDWLVTVLNRDIPNPYTSAPIITNTPPVVTNTPPAITNTPPVATNTPPVVTNTPPTGGEVLSTNLIANGGLDIKDPAEPNMPFKWKKGGFGVNNRSFIYPSDVIDDVNFAAAVEITEFTSGDAKWYFEEVPVEAGTAYSYGNSYECAADTIITAQYRLMDGSLFFKQLKQLPPSFGWTTWSNVFVTPTNAAAMTVFHSLVSKGRLSIDEVTLFKVSSNTPEEGMVSFNFDDGWKSAWLAASNSLSKAAFRGTFYIVTKNVGKSGMISRNDLNDMRAGGHEIGAHTVSHADLTKISADEAKTEILECRKTLNDWGAEVGTFAYPFGAYNTALKTTLKENGFIASRGTEGGYNERNTDLLALKARSVRSSNTFADITAWIDQAASRKQWLILVFHHIDKDATEYSITPELFDAIVDYVKSKNVRVVTNRDGVRTLFGV